MTTEKRIELLLRARNILHKQESGEVLTSQDIILAHDYVDMVIGDLCEEEFEKKMKNRKE